MRTILLALPLLIACAHKAPTRPMTLEEASMTRDPNSKAEVKAWLDDTTKRTQPPTEVIVEKIDE